jgi:hypothetical protein
MFFVLFFRHLYDFQELGYVSINSDQNSLQHHYPNVSEIFGNLNFLFSRIKSDENEDILIFLFRIKSRESQICPTELYQIFINK